MPRAAGEVLNNRYRIVGSLGQGGFGAVYYAWDITFEVPCAIKENFEIGEAAQRQFLREARLLYTLRHPNLPQVKDYFVIPGQGQYLVMDFVEGDDLAQKLAATGGPLPEPQVVAWASQICDALSYLHSQNPPVIHRDIKPANIKITPDGQAMLVDFGIAKLFDPNARTMTGARAMTPGYSPPEQYGQGTTDARSDVYALGATLYTLLSKQVPPDSIDLLTRRAALVPLQQANRAVSHHIAAAVEKAMQLDDKQRFQSAAELREAISFQQSALSEGDAQLARTAWIGNSPYETRSVPPARQPRWLPESGMRVLAGALAVIGLVIVVGLGGRFYNLWPGGGAAATTALLDASPTYIPLTAPAAKATTTAQAVIQQTQVAANQELMKYLSEKTRHFKGDANAPVTIIEFSDFQCPYCGVFAADAGRLIDENYVKNGKVRFGYWNFAFLGDESQWAAEAAECAADQGKYWEMHDKLYASQKGENEGAFSKDNLKQMATDLGLDSASFNECLDSGKHSQQVASDTALAQQIGVQSTPAFLVAGQPLIGAQPFAKFQEMIERNLQQK